MTLIALRRTLAQAAGLLLKGRWPEAVAVIRRQATEHVPTPPGPKPAPPVIATVISDPAATEPVAAPPPAPVEIVDVPPDAAAPAETPLAETPFAEAPAAPPEIEEAVMTDADDIGVNEPIIVKRPRTPRRKTAAIKPPPPEVSHHPDSGQFLDRTISNEAGSRDYKVYIPAGYRGEPLPLLVMLHGCGQGPDDFALGTGMNARADAERLMVVYPAQSSAANNARCWNWFNHHDQQRDSGEPSLIIGIVEAVSADYAIDPARIYAAGLSAGGAAAAILAAAYPDLFAAVAIHSGLPYGAARTIPSAFMVMQRGAEPNTALMEGRRRVPTIVFHGDQDTTCHPRNGEAVIAQALAAEGPALTLRTETGESEAGYAYTRTLYTPARGGDVLEHWAVHGAAHAWLGGDPAGSYTDAKGPDASREILRFLLTHRLPAAKRLQRPAARETLEVGAPSV